MNVQVLEPGGINAPARPLYSAAVWLLLAVSVVPTAAGLAAALVAGLDRDALAAVLATPGVGLAVASSVWTGLIATLVALCLAHLAVALAHTRAWPQRLQALTLPILAMPHLAVGIGLAIVLSPSGILMRLLSPWASGFELPPDWLIVSDPAGISLMLGLVLKETCFLILALTAALGQVPSERLLLQSRTLGYGALKAWLTSVAPLLQRQIRWAVAAVLVFGIGNVELAIPLGPDLPPTFSVLLWRWFTDPDPAIHAQAYAGTLVLLVVTLLVVGSGLGVSRIARFALWRVAESGARRTGDHALRRGLTLVLASGWLLGMFAIAGIVLRAAAGPWRFPKLLPQRGAGDLWQQVVPMTADVSGVTVGLALATAVFGVLLILPAAERCRASAPARRQVGAWLFVPLLVPQMTFLFGVQVLLVRLNIDGTLFAVVWSHILFALPYIWGVLAPTRAAIDPRYGQVAATLGVGAAKTWLTVTAPLLLRATLLALALAFSVSLALYLPTLFTGAGRIATATTEAAAAAGSGNLRLASLYAILLAVAPLAAFAAAYGAGALVFRHRKGVPR